MQLRNKLLLFSCLPCLISLSCCQRFDGSQTLPDVVYRDSYRSLYDEIGRAVTLNEVTEGGDGRAYASVNGKTYELGMDFLSMAMVYNATPTAAFPTATDAYGEWWRLFMQRWNWLVPELPLYSNEYYDVYNAKLDDFRTTPFRSAADALVGAKVVKGENAVILGNNTELSGAFRNSSFGKSSPAASDLAVERLTSGYSTVETNADGEYEWADERVLRARAEGLNADGTKTFELYLAEDLTFSDGTKITAQNYVLPLLVTSSPVMREAGGADTSGINLVGYEDFHAYDGEGEPTPFSGVRLLDEYAFSVTVKKEYANYYYALRYGEFSPLPTALYGGRYEVKDDGRGAYLEQGFYSKTEKNGAKSFVMAAEITENLKKLSERDFPYAGPYVVESYDPSARIATLKRNARYKGDSRGVPSIDKISYVKIVAETQLDQLQRGRVDVLASVTGGDETRAALALVDNVRFKENHYDRAGYGKLAFRCDFGPTQFPEVRRAIAYTIDRDEFAQTFTGGYGSVVHAPYYVGSKTYAAVQDRLRLNDYAYDMEEAKAELIAGGWIYDGKGGAYEEGKGVRYKKLSGYEKTYANLTYAAADGRERTVKIGEEYYMPLVINWMGTQPNAVTDQLISSWLHNPNANEKIGARITYASGTMNAALYGEYAQMPSYGFTKARYGAVNFATGFTGAAFDQAYAWTIDPDKYAHYSVNYLRDEADFWQEN